MIIILIERFKCVEKNGMYILLNNPTSLLTRTFSWACMTNFKYDYIMVMIMMTTTM